MVDSYGYTEICHCGHDRATHYRDLTVLPHVTAACLARGCDCPAYLNEREPRPAVLRRKNTAPPADRQERTTDPWPPPMPRP
jgi:hypothetical protein